MDSLPEEFFKKILDAIPACLAVKDEQGRFVYLNSKDAALYGKRPEEMIGKTVEPFVGRAQFLAWLESDNLEMQMGQPVAYPINSRQMPNGEQRWLSTVKVPLHSGQHPHHDRLLVIHWDVTQIKEAEEERDAARWQSVQAQKFETAGLLAANVAHVFNNYLSTVSSATELLANPGALDEAKRAALLGRLQKATGEAGFLVRQIQVLADKAEPLMAPLRLNEFIETCRPLWRSTVGDRHPLRLDLCEQDPFVSADERLLQQAILCLLLNARTASRQGSSVAIQTRRKEDRVELLVIDEGEGMTQQVQDRLFTPFFSTRPRGQGAGLGLLTVKTIMKLHEGDVRVESRIGHGTVVTLDLPSLQMPRPHAKPPRPHSKAASLAGVRILVVDDEEHLRWVTCQLLLSLGAHVSSCSTADEVVALWESQPPDVDLVITDITMPGSRDGVELRRFLGERSPQLPVLLISGYTFDKCDQLKLGPRTDFLAKPFNLPQLLDHIRLLVP